VNQISESASSVGYRALTASLAPEWELLLATCADPRESDAGRIRGLLGRSRPVDWEAVLRLAEHHGSSSLMYQNFSRLGDMVPSATLELLRQRYEKNVHKSLVLARERIRILD
jgi:hypothetical protein